MKDKTQIDFRSIALEELQKLKSATSKPVYTGLVKSCLKGREMELLRNRLLKTELPRHDMELARQEELIEFMDKDLQKILADIELENDFIKRLEAERAEVYEQYLKALNNLKKIDKRLSEASEVMRQFNSSKDSINEAIELAEKRRSNTNRIVLVHKSASIGQLMQYSFGEIVVTEADADYLNGIIVPDQIFDKSLAEDMIGELPFNFRSLSETEYTSVKQFVEMAMYYYVVEDEMPVILYANNDIATALKKEGV